MSVTLAVVIDVPLVALLGITWTAWYVYRQQAFGEKRSLFVVFDEAYDRDTAITFSAWPPPAALLPCGPSFVAVVYVGSAALFVGTCA